MRFSIHPAALSWSGHQWRTYRASIYYANERLAEGKAQCNPRSLGQCLRRAAMRRWRWERQPDRTRIPSNGFFLFLEDVEAAYARALAGGATAVRPPADIPYGLRSAIVKDPEGYMWWTARWIS